MTTNTNDTTKKNTLAAQTPPSETGRGLQDAAAVAALRIKNNAHVWDYERIKEVILEELAALRPSDPTYKKLREDIKALEFNCEAYEEELDRLKELVGYHGGEGSLVDYIRDLKKPLEQHLNRVGKGDNLEYLITQACNKIFNGNIPLGFCSAHLSEEEKPHAETAECKGWRSSGMGTPPNKENMSTDWNAGYKEGAKRYHAGFTDGASYEHSRLTSGMAKEPTKCGSGSSQGTHCILPKGHEDVHRSAAGGWWFNEEPTKEKL